MRRLKFSLAFFSDKHNKWISDHLHCTEVKARTRKDIYGKQGGCSVSWHLISGHILLTHHNLFFVCLVDSTLALCSVICPFSCITVVHRKRKCSKAIQTTLLEFSTCMEERYHIYVSAHASGCFQILKVHGLFSLQGAAVECNLVPWKQMDALICNTGR